MTINDYMTPTEAAYRWNISADTLKDRLKASRRNEDTIQGYLDKGLIKYFAKPGAKRGEWIISRAIMEIWYGLEPQNIGGIMMTQPIKLDGQTLDLAVLSGYMNDGLREELNDLNLKNQAYIDMYIKRAKEEDAAFIEVLASEFSVNV